MYQYTTTVRLHETDAAGILFFGNYLKIAHDAYEQFMTSIGYDFRSMIEDSPFLVLIVHTDADYHRSLVLGEQFEITVCGAKIGKTSFTLKYLFVNRDGQPVATVHTAHVAVDKKTNRPVALPDNLREELGKIS